MSAIGNPSLSNARGLGGQAERLWPLVMAAVAALA